MAYDPAHGVTASGEAGQRDHLSDALDEVDRHIRGRFGQITGGQSMWAALQAWEDWIFHSLVSPGRQAKLAWRWADRVGAIGRSEFGAPAADTETKPVDRRFRAESWKQWPYSIFANAQLAIEAQWRDAARQVRGVSEHHARRVEFMGQFLLNALAPCQFYCDEPRGERNDLADGWGERGCRSGASGR